MVKLESLLMIFLIVLFALVIYLLLEFRALRTKLATKSDDLKTVHDDIYLLSENLKQLIEKADRSQQLFSEAFTEVRTKLDEVRRTAEAARELKEILRTPKGKGAFGESSLYSLVTDFLPRSSYNFQYRFKNGAVADLVLKVGDKLLPVDSKFPADRYAVYLTEKNEGLKKQLAQDLKRAVKKHVEEIAQKYIRQQENTFDFALMFIPSEGLYYELACDEEFSDLYDYFRKQNVYPVSPNTLYIYLAAVTSVLKQLELEKNLEEVMGRLKQLERNAERFLSELSTFNSHLKNAYSASERLNRTFNELFSNLKQLLEIKEDNS
jgi:DNA recombination protein RmuC